MKALFKVASAAFLFACGPAAAEALCLPHEAFVETLTTEYGEAPLLTGLRPGGSRIEIWASHDGATWTVLIVMPGDVACMMDSGEYMTAAPPLAAVPEPSAAPEPPGDPA